MSKGYRYVGVGGVQWLLVAVVLSALGACGGGGSDVGEQDDKNPVASAQALGVSSNIEGTVTARSGSEVLLSGKESDGIDDPILEFQWRQVDNTGVTVELVERTANNSSFTAPRVAQVTNLEFELTVLDSKGTSATDRVTVSVIPATDSDVFLLQEAAGDKQANYYEFMVAVEPGRKTNSSFRLRLDTSVTWVDRTGQSNSLLLDSETIEGEWPAGVTGTDEPALDYFNPRFIRTIPSLDVDDINRRFEDANRDMRLETSDIDEARVFVNFVFESFDTHARLVLLDSDGGTTDLIVTAEGAIETGPVDADVLRAAAGLQTQASAQKYYALINAPATLSEWLQQAGFGPDPENQAGVAHARYTNNYDLNFGRDMYLRVDEECGNVYSYVGNYPSLETTLQNRNNFATVVMEYSPIDGGCNGDKIVKFFNYVPDDTSGDAVLVTSMDFDGRGEKYVPGVCTVCHGGGPQDYTGFSLDDIAGMDDATRLGLADLDSTFMLWDLDAFLYTDDDPSLSPRLDRVSADQRERFTREAQEAEFRALNEGALRTFTDDPERHAASIKLLHGWYGGYATDSECGEDGTEAMPANPGTLPAGAFDGGYVPCGWRSDPDLYHSVYVRNCRMCHTQLADTSLNYDSVDEFVGDARIPGTVFEDGLMPLARLTYDRFWSDFNGGTPAANQLAERIGVSLDEPLALPILDVDITVRNPDSGDFKQEPDVGDIVYLDASDSSFVDSFQWTLQSDCGTDPVLVGATSALANFMVEVPACAYRLTLTATNAAGSRTEEITVESADPRPVAEDFTAPLDDFDAGDDTLVIDVLEQIVEVGDGDLEVIINDADLGLAINENVLNNGDGTLTYLIDNPFGVEDEVQYQLRDATGSLSSGAGTISVVIDPIKPTLGANPSPTAITLFWNFAAAASVDGYRVYRGTSADELTLLDNVQGGTNRQYVDSPLVPNSTFYYQVSAFAGDFESARSSPPLMVQTVENPFTGLMPTSVSFDAITITWDALTGAVEYIVRRENVEVGRTTSRTFEDTDVIPDETYTYTVVGVFADDSLSNASNGLEVTADSVPETGSVSVATGKETDCSDAAWVTASWTAVAGVDGYNVYYKDVRQNGSPLTDLSLTVNVDDSNELVDITVYTVYRGVESPTGETGSGQSCVSYTADVYPDWSGFNCASSSCHGGTSTIQPEIDVQNADNVYNALIPGFRSGNNIFCLTNNLKKAGGTCGSGAMSSIRDASDIPLVQRWLLEGGDNN